MATIAERPEVSPRTPSRWGYGWTIADLASLPDQLAGKPVKWELWDGELVPLAPPGEDHAIVGGYLCTELGIHGRKSGAGWVLTEVSVTFGEEENTLLIPDLAFKTQEQISASKLPETVAPTVPAIVAEIRSPTNRAGQIREKIERYLAGGAQLVWDIDPQRRRVTAHRPGEAPVVFQGTDTLTAEGIIPDFSLPLEELFSGLG